MLKKDKLLWTIKILMALQKFKFLNIYTVRTLMNWMDFHKMDGLYKNTKNLAIILFLTLKWITFTEGTYNWY